MYLRDHLARRKIRSRLELPQLAPAENAHLHMTSADVDGEYSPVPLWLLGLWFHRRETIPQFRPAWYGCADMVNSRFALVIFDCDGVLVDSELITNRVFTKMLNELGVAVSNDEAFEKFVGKSMAQCLEMIAGLLGREVPADFVRRYDQRSAAALTSELKAVPGIEAALEAIQVPYCVASNGSHEKMQTTLGITGLLPKFKDKLFSVSEVARGKPFPDVFLHAAGKFGVAPSGCAVIEDTPTGVSAGVAAGMTVYGYCAHTPAHRLIAAGAHGTFGRMSDLPELLLDAVALRR
jgi:HAD superfamily hydrolase (TIGR01509 family)